ncbi:MAG TPA: DUF885 family protein [Streptosporangiaceae bacterium]|nr:DUF885 family protein [Streptosporangiaceae bacterium]
MAEINPRLRAVLDLSVPEAREYAGRHEYDGKIQDLSPDGIRAALARMDAAASQPVPLGDDAPDEYDSTVLTTFERALHVTHGELEFYRINPYYHVANMDLACYDRDYGAEDDRARARAEHLGAWPDAVDAAIAALDRVPAPIAKAVAGAVRGLAAGIPADRDKKADAAALAAHARLVAHIDDAAANGQPDAALGAAGLSKHMSAVEGTEVDLGRLAGRADAERDRLRERLAESCARIDSSRPAMAVARELVRVHPDADGVLDAARSWTERVIEFTRDANLVPYQDGECLVEVAPESRRWAMAMMSSAAPGEPEGPSIYYITPPDPSWPAHEAEEWLEVFSDTTLPGITAHEVAPGHFSHGRAIRRAPTLVRQSLHSEAFTEGWAHYAEELCVEEGFCADDPRFAIGVWLEALVRVTRLACAIGLHTAGQTVEDCARRFEADTHLSGQAALSEATRATFDPGYGRYTWGKLEIMDLRSQARQAWGSGFSLLRFHSAMLALGSPPLGLLGTALRRG